MGALQVLGGRKFLMAFVAIGAAMFLEIGTQKGLTPTMAGFLVAMVGTFSAVNYASSVRLTPGRGQSNDDDDDTEAHLLEFHRKMDDVTLMMQKGAANPDSLQTLLSTLGTMRDDISQTKNTVGQVGQAVVALGQQRRG